jgi:hypothetical protein
VAPFQFLRIEPFHYVFGKQNRTAPFFVWLKSRIEWSRSVHCLVEEPYECGGKEREGERSRPLVLVEREHSKYLAYIEWSHSISLRFSTKHTLRPKGAIGWRVN